MTTAKRRFYFLLGWIDFWWWRNKSLVRRVYSLKVYIKELLPTGFCIQWRSFVYITYIRCQSGRLTSAKFEHFMCHRYIWYIFSFVCSVFVIQKTYDVMNILVHFLYISIYILYIYIYIYIYIHRSKLLKIKHKVKWMAKFVKT